MAKKETPLRQAGDQNHAAKLTSASVARIRALGGRVTQAKLAARFGVSPSCIGLILRRERWSHAA